MEKNVLFVSPEENLLTGDGQVGRNIEPVVTDLKPVVRPSDSGARPLRNAAAARSKEPVKKLALTVGALALAAVGLASYFKGDVRQAVNSLSAPRKLEAAVVPLPSGAQLVLEKARHGRVETCVNTTRASMGAQSVPAFPSFDQTSHTLVSIAQTGECTSMPSRAVSCTGPAPEGTVDGLPGKVVDVQALTAAYFTAHGFRGATAVNVQVASDGTCTIAKYGSLQANLER